MSVSVSTSCRQVPHAPSEMLSGAKDYLKVCSDGRTPRSATHSLACTNRIRPANRMPYCPTAAHAARRSRYSPPVHQLVAASWPKLVRTALLMSLAAYPSTRLATLSTLATAGSTGADTALWG